MPIVLVIIGAMFVIAGIKNNGALLSQTIASDFSGAGSFWYWIIAIIVIGSIGYYQPAQKVSHLFLFLVVLVFVLSNGGVYSQFTSAISAPTPAASNTGAGGSTGVDSAASPVAAPGGDLGAGILKWAQSVNPALGLEHMLGVTP